jgi:hypothetical protein
VNRHIVGDRSRRQDGSKFRCKLSGVASRGRLVYMSEQLPDVYVPSGIPSGPAGITCGRGTVAGICKDVPASNLIAGV